MLIPTYRPRVKQSRAELREVTVWPQEAIPALQDCFDSTEWSIFSEAATYDNVTNLDEYTESVIGYINKCTDDVTEVRTIRRRANQKPWLTGEVRALLRTRNEAFKSGDIAAFRLAKQNLTRGTREAKRQYGRKLNGCFSDNNDPRRLWQGFKTLSDYIVPPTGWQQGPLLAG